MFFLRQPYPVLWMTGLSGSGKTTLARRLKHELSARYQVSRATLLDGDELRQGLCSNLGFSQEDRTENIRRTAEVACLMHSAGVLPIVSLISPLRSQRALARKIVGDKGLMFLEVYISASIQTAETRDVKGLYAKARANEVGQFTGVSSLYEPPTTWDLIVDTNSAPPEQSLHSLLMQLYNIQVIDSLPRTSKGLPLPVPYLGDDL